MLDVVYHCFDNITFSVPKLQEGLKIAETMHLIVDETIKLMEALTWLPGVRRLLEVYRDRFSPPVALVPTDMRDLQVREIMDEELYCLTFRKP